MPDLSSQSGLTKEEVAFQFNPSSNSMTLESTFSTSPWKYTPKKEHPLFTTTSNQYGGVKPTAMELPKKRFTVSRKFSEHLNQAGPYKNYSLNIK